MGEFCSTRGTRNAKASHIELEKAYAEKLWKDGEFNRSDWSDSRSEEIDLTRKCSDPGYEHKARDKHQQTNHSLICQPLSPFLSPS